MILNIVIDDKFVPFLQGLFEEALPRESLWRVFTEKPSLIFADQINGTKRISGEYFSSQEFRSDLQAASCVVFHSLFLSSFQKLLVLLRMPKNIPVVWRGWGFDYYGILQTNGLRLTLPETNLLVQKPSILSRILVKSLPRKLLNAVLSKVAGKTINNQLFKRIDYFACCVPDDFKALQRVLPDFKAQFLPLNYYSAEDIFLRGNSLQYLSGHDILLGNSATPTNNHIEAMRVLSKLDLRDRKVVVPLSYGDMHYQKKIIQAGEDFFGESFVPLVNYMPLAEYNQLVSGCGNLIMNHIRQQAMGNISAALLRGGKVFLRPENPIYRYYTRMGVTLFPFSDGMTVADLDAPLNEVTIRENKEILAGIWSREQGIKQVKAISLLKSKCD